MSMDGVQQGPNGMLPQFPLEIFDIVATHADQRTITQLCLVNSAVGEVAASRLYADVCLVRPALTLKYLKTASKHPELAKHTRVLMIQLDVTTPPCLTDAFGRLFGRALRNMPLLVALELNLCEHALGRYLRGSPARIIDLSLLCDWDADLSSWLGEQSAVRRFMFYGPPHSPLDPSALPNLQSIYATPAVISSVVPGRPVKQVLILAYSPRVFTEPAVEHMARSCKSSTGPVSAVYVIHRIHHVAPGPPEETFRVLSAIPRHLPGLTRFSLQAGSYSLEEPLIEMFLDFVSEFRHLLYLDCCTKELGRLGEPSTSNLSQLARSIGERCPSLRSIRFGPSTIYAHCSTGEWAGLEEIKQLYRDIATSLESTLLADPAVALEAKVPLLRGYREMNRAFVEMNVVVQRGSTTESIFDLMTFSGLDEELFSSISRVYGIGSRLLRIARGAAGSR